MLVDLMTATDKNMSPHLSGGEPAAFARGISTKEDDLPQSVDMNNLIENVQKSLDLLHNVDLRFSVHKSSGQIMVTVTDESTGKVVREIPPKEVLNFAAKFDEMVGLIFDQQV